MLHTLIYHTHPSMFYCHGRITHPWYVWLLSLNLRDVLTHWIIGHHRMETISNYNNGLFKIWIWFILYNSYIISPCHLICVINQNWGARILIVFVMSVVLIITTVSSCSFSICSSFIDWQALNLFQGLFLWIFLISLNISYFNEYYLSCFSDFCCRMLPFDCIYRSIIR